MSGFDKIFLAKKNKIDEGGQEGRVEVCHYEKTDDCGDNSE